MRILLLIAFFIFLSSSAYSSPQSPQSPQSDSSSPNYQYKPNPVDLNDLDHAYYYKWGFKLGIDLNEVKITSASITFHKIRNWNNQNFSLYVHLLDDPAIGVEEINDSSPGMVDALSGQGRFLHEYTKAEKLIGTRSRNVTYEFTQADLLDLNNWAFDGTIGLGFDPDCHFWNNGIAFNITTSPVQQSEVPEPATMLLFGTGLVGLAGFRMRKKKR